MWIYTSVKTYHLDGFTATPVLATTRKATKQRHTTNSVYSS